MSIFSVTSVLTESQMNGVSDNDGISHIELISWTTSFNSLNNRWLRYGYQPHFMHEVIEVQKNSMSKTT